MLLKFHRVRKWLGIIFDQKFFWYTYICEISRNLFSAVSTKIALIFLLSLVFSSVIIYADTCYLDITEEQLYKLEHI